ncbi:MAG: hypothetical protein CMD09_03210 [Flavobacteriales bacterium]|nr:hypothetical protein [Flavobacteriales bacterium]|tara:strand:- start:775 stop:1005 length:231 start_codon:yes stop_codon:yes gene_type:complete
MKKTIQITSDREPILFDRKLMKDEIVEMDSEMAELFISKNLAVEKTSAKPKKRARNERGHWKSDDPSTPEVNEAYE